MAPSKPLPPPARDEKLPSLPPIDVEGFSSAPPPPPKIVHDDSTPDPHEQAPHKPLAPIDVKASLTVSELSTSFLATSFYPSSSGQSPTALGSAPLTPVTPLPGQMPPSPSHGGDKAKKSANPLTDLIETEKSYVDQLTGIIRKVAAAWSRANLPPPELDTMFRSIESIYKANRSLLAKLKEIGTNPKGLGDLLMRWIDDLEGPYTNYSNKYCSGFDTWEPVQTNPRIRTILAMFSSSCPPPLPLSAPVHPAEPPIWTLDELFILPKYRIKYYKKLYNRLLKSTTPGRSDYRMLSAALEKLDKLLATIDSRAGVRVGGSIISKEDPTPPIETEDEVVIDMRTRQSTLEPQAQAPQSGTASPSQRASDSTRASGSLSSSGRRSEETALTTDSRTSTSTLSMPIIDLERRLSTERTLDIFTMKPKQVRLQIAPPNLHYTRELRCSTSVIIHFTSRSTGAQIVQERGHIFLLTDLMLVCEKMSPKELEVAGPNGADMWLLYPPLAGKHLRVAPVDDVTLSVTILRKETLNLQTDSTASRDRLIADFSDCIETAATLFPPSKNPPPPVPALPSFPGSMGNNASRPPSAPQERSQPPSAVSTPPPPERFNGGMSPPRAFSPASMTSRRSGDPPSRVNSSGVALADAALTGDMSRMNIGTGGGHGIPPRGTSSSSPGGSGGFGPGQVIPPGGGFGPGALGPGQTVPPYTFAPGQHMPPQVFAPGQHIPLQNGYPGQGTMGRPPPGAYVPPGGGPGAQRHPSFGHGPPAPGPNGTPPSRQPSLTSGQIGPPQVGQSYQGMGAPQHRSGQPPMGNGMYPPQPGMHPGGQGGPYPPPRPPSEPSVNGLRKMPSTTSLGGGSQGPQQRGPQPPMPGYPGDLPPPRPGFLQRSGSSSSLPNMVGGLQAPQPRPILPSAQLSMRSVSTAGSFSIEEPSPPGSPVEEILQHTGPVTSTVTAQMKCKVFLKQQHAQWKSLGSAKLRLFREDPTNIKQLVVESDDKRKNVLISTIVLTDGVERVGKTGVAIELSDKGMRTGVVYMIQLRNEKSAGGLFDELLAGSDRANGR